jgi:hypothetical protein
LKFRPSFQSCLSFAGKLTGWLVGAVVVLGLLADLVQGRPPLGVIVREPLTFLAIFLGLWIAFAVTFYLTLRIWTWSVLADGVRGRSYWGRRVDIRWDDVDRVYATAIEGIPVLGVVARDARREAMLYVMGVDLTVAHRALLMHAGPDHMLTLAFAPRPVEVQRDI